MSPRKWNAADSKSRCSLVARPPPLHTRPSRSPSITPARSCMSSTRRAQCPSPLRCSPQTNATASSATTSRNKNRCAKISSAGQKKKPSHSSKPAPPRRNTIGRTTLRPCRHSSARGRLRCPCATSSITSTGLHSFMRGNCAVCGIASTRCSRRRMPMARPKRPSSIAMRSSGSIASSKATISTPVASTDSSPRTRPAMTSSSGPMKRAAPNAHASTACANKSKKTPANPTSPYRIG